MMTDEQRREELSNFLVCRRNQLDPRDFGIVVNGRRRAPGLRREEVALQAGISATWYVRLEQGRDVRASAHTLDRIAKALRLAQPERAYLMRLARPDLDWKSHSHRAERPSDALLSLLAGLAPHPAYVVDRYWHVVAMNDPATALLGAFHEEDPWSTSLIARIFLDPRWRSLFRDWREVARAAVAQFRLAMSGHGLDPVLRPMIAMLERESPEFAAGWNSHEVAEPPVWRKTLVLPGNAERTFDFAILRPSGADSDFFVSIYTAVAEEKQSR